MIELIDQQMSHDVNRAHLEKLAHLPDGWVESSVSELTKIISTTHKKLAQKRYQEKGKFPVVDQGQGFIAGYSNDNSLVLDEEFPFIVFGDHTRAFKFVNFAFIPGADGVKVLKPLEVDPKWCFYIFQAIKLPNKGYARHFQYLKESYIPVPPPEQQKRIVAKIEELFSHIDAGIKALKKAKQLLKQYRQSILKAAVTGELTKEWREANKNKLEPASQLLKCILKERRRKWEEKQLEKFKAKGKVPKDDKWKRKYKEPDVPDNSDLPTIPNEWLWSGFEQVSSPQKNGMKAGPFGSALKKKFYVEKGYKIYGQEQVISGNPYSGNYYISEEKYQSLINCSVQPGDFLISLVGTIGRTLVLPNDIESGIINPRLIKITFDKEFCLPEYMQIYIASPAAKQIFKLSSHGGTMDVLNMSTLKALPLPLPSVSEQQVIVEMVNEREETIERQLKYIDNQLRLIKKNKQSVLASAFSGSLNSM